MSDDQHPELAGYEPGDGPVRRPMTRHVMRIVVIIGLVSLVLPGIVVTLTTQATTASTACGLVVAAAAPDAVAASARFELVGVEGPGWYCYARQFDGSEMLLRALGIIPGLSFEPSGVPA